MKKGLHGRNDRQFTQKDFEVFSRAGIELAVMMSFTADSAFKGLRDINPKMDFIVRLYDHRIGTGGPTTPDEFADLMYPDIERLKPFTKKFQVHNEPNHVAGIEGWGSTDDDARDFAYWYSRVLSTLKARHPWARFGFPGLALNHPHRDFAWLDICRCDIEDSHWLGCHCYWQYGNKWSEDWGMRFTQYHRRFPDKRIHMTEFGNSTPGLRDDQMANQYRDYYRELRHYDYLGSASSFIASSPDPTWAPFAWLWENGVIRPVADAVRKA